MSSFLSIGPNLVPSPSPDRTRTRTLNHLLHRTHHLGLSHHATPFSSRRNLGVARLGLDQLPFSDPDGAEGLIRDLFGRAEGFFYTIADAAVSASPDSVTTSKQSNDWLSGITNYMEFVLKVLKDGLSAVHVPYSYGFAIILLTVLVKAATFPLTKKQVESSMAMRSLQPQIKAIQQRYAGDQEKIQLETARIYKLAGINPLAGCLPTLATIPVWIGLYRALSNVADEGLLTEGFFWIPSLAGPTTIAARQSGSGISWLFPFVDGHPPLGWPDTFAYLVLPVLLVLSQYISVQIMQSSQQSNDPNMKTSQAITKFLPLMIGYFSLSVPSGLSLYWFTNNILSTAQQVWLQKLGGAKNTVSKITDIIGKEGGSQIEKTTLETTTTLKEPKAKQSTSGPRPGERFRQLKEQEERRKRQKEEERRKSEEVAAAANTTQVTNGVPNKEASSVQRESNGGAESSDIVNGNGNSANGIDHSSRISTSNGDVSTLPSKEDQKTSIKSEDEGNGQVLHGNAEKDVVGNAHSEDRKVSGEVPTGDRSE